MVAKRTSKTSLSRNPGITEPLDCLAGRTAPADFEATRNLQARATQTTQVLDEILHNYGHGVTRPPHWGLNE